VVASALVKLVSTDPSEIGILSVGQFAHGIFAFGQFARGFIAVGQVAIGVVAIGQLSSSVLGVGQAGGGIAWFAGMGGVGGRGICLRLIPGLDLPRDTPPLVDLGAAMRGEVRGFVHVDVASGASGARLASGGHVLPVKMSPSLARARAHRRASDRSGGRDLCPPRQGRRRRRVRPAHPLSRARAGRAAARRRAGARRR
jgi:hypothetical protein